MRKIFIVSDNGVPSGYGRIADELGVRLQRKGYQIMAASLQYDGLLPPMYEGQPLPYWVGSLAGHDDWAQRATSMLTAYNPDVLLSIQDFTWQEQLYAAPLDWSRIARVLITPVDGVPIYPNWLRTLDKADAALTISHFGKEAFRKAGREVGLCIPGINPATFYRRSEEERLALRTRLGLTAAHYVVGIMAMNQGRKCISLMLRAFFDFALDKPHARLLMDMDSVSPAGWDIPGLCESYGWDASKLIFRAGAIQAGLSQLAERYNVLDTHMVISHREGYGLPLVESMACGVPTLALDYCSGTEICGEGRGVLVKETGYRIPGSWGGAEDAFPDMEDLKRQLQRLYEDPLHRALVARTGEAWAKTQTWDASAQHVEQAIEKAIARRDGKLEASPIG